MVGAGTAGALANAPPFAAAPASFTAASRRPALRRLTVVCRSSRRNRRSPALEAEVDGVEGDGSDRPAARAEASRHTAALAAARRAALPMLGAQATATLDKRLVSYACGVVWGAVVHRWGKREEA